MGEREIDFHIAADTILSPSVELLGRKREFGGIWGGIRCSSWWKVPGEEKLRALGELSLESCQCCPPRERPLASLLPPPPSANTA